MNETQRQMNNLILGVTHVCARMRELAESGAREPAALLPLRESLDMVQRTLRGIELLWEQEAVPPREPAVADGSWLLDPGRPE